MPENPNRVEIARRVDKAEKLLQKGKTAEALAEYLLVLQDDPQNDNVRQMAADLCLSLNKGPQAVTLLGELFDRQVAAMEATRASLTYKKLARYTDVEEDKKSGVITLSVTDNDRDLAAARFDSMYRRPPDYNRRPRSLASDS